MGVVALTEADDQTQELVESSGTVYYNAQFADSELTVKSTGNNESIDLGPLFDGTTVNFVTDSGVFGEETALETPSIVYHLIPILILVTAGFLLAQYLNLQTIQDGVLAGGTIVLGTFPLSLLGVFIFVTSDNSSELGPVLLDSVIFVGILFPLIFGAVGAALSTRI